MYGRWMVVPHDEPGDPQSNAPPSDDRTEIYGKSQPAAFSPQEVLPSRHLAKVKKRAPSCRGGPITVLPSSGVWTELSIEYLTASVPRLPIELSQLKRWVYTPLLPFSGPAFADENLTTFP